MSVSELTELQQFISELKIMKNKSGLSVGQRVYVVQKTKKTWTLSEKSTRQERLLIW